MPEYAIGSGICMTRKRDRHLQEANHDISGCEQDQWHGRVLEIGAATGRYSLDRCLTCLRDGDRVSIPIQHAAFVMVLPTCRTQNPATR